MLRLRISILIIMLGLGQAMPLQLVGFLSGRIAYQVDSLQTSGGMLVHAERFHWGVKGTAPALWNLEYRLTGGGVFTGGTATSGSRFTPEYGLRTRLHPAAVLDVALFSYSRLRNPLQVTTDSLVLKEFVHGVRFGMRVSERTHISLATGLRNQQINHRDSVSTTDQFVQLNIDQRFAGLQFRLGGEQNTWSHGTLAGHEQQRAYIQWYGSPLNGLRWSAFNRYYRTDGNTFWRISHHLNYRLSQRQTLWASYFQGNQVYNSRTLQQQNYALSYRFHWKPAWGVELALKGNRVAVPDSLDIFHWRWYGVRSFWDRRGRGFLRGNLNAGFKESYRFGKGMDVLLVGEEFLPLYRSALLELQVRDDLSAEVFQRFDETVDPRYDLRHKFQLTGFLLPGSRFAWGNELKFYNHFGSDLDFSPDTLRNAVIDELFYRSYGQRTRLALSYRTVLDLNDADNDLRFYFNTHWYHRFSGNVALSFTARYRFHSDLLSDYLWLNAAWRYRTPAFSYALELQSRGLPADISTQNTMIWARFMRHL